MYRVLLLVTMLIACGHGSDDAMHQPLAVLGEPMPIVKIQTSKKIQDEPKVAASMQIVLNDSVLFNSKIGIEYRGAVSQMFYEKKSYGVEIWDEKNNNISKSLLGLPSDNDWILHGPYADKSLIRNVLAYQISNSIGRYAPRTKFVELEINGDFKGLYVLMEKIKRGKERVNVEKLSPKTASLDSISGGYIIKLDKTVGSGYSDQGDYNDSNSFPSLFNQSGKPTKRTKTHFLYDYPKSKQISDIQKTYIKTYVQSFEKALASANFSDENTGFRAFIDEDSFIDFFLLTELLQNFDGFRISTYLQKDRGEKLKMGPVWDFDLSLGSRGFCHNMNDDKNYWIHKYNNYCGGDSWIVPFWWSRLLQDENFATKLNIRWQELRKKEFSDKTLIEMIEGHQTYLKKTKAIERNFHRWDILEKEIEPNETKGSHEEEIERIKNWLVKRTAWMDQEIPKL